jgi:hypothetical protein
MAMSTPETRWTKAVGYARTHGLKLGLEVAINFVLPFLIYDLGRGSLGDVKALMASSAPPIAWSIIEFARERKVDALSILVVGGIVLSLVGFAGGGGVKFLQLRENLVNGVIGLVFLGSAAIGKPLIYELARASMRRTSPDGAAEFEALRDNVHFRRTMTVLTLVWGVGLVALCAAHCVLVFAVSIKQYLLISPPTSYATAGLLIAWSFWYVSRARRRGRERTAAAALAQAGQTHSPTTD